MISCESLILRKIDMKLLSFLISDAWFKQQEIISKSFSMFKSSTSTKKPETNKKALKFRTGNIENLSIRQCTLNVELCGHLKAFLTSCNNLVSLTISKVTENKFNCLFIEELLTVLKESAGFLRDLKSLDISGNIITN